jgi:predicted 2-oxoglutarate/Fe(II)-dependent dioxygenase YbiX
MWKLTTATSGSFLSLFMGAPLTTLAWVHPSDVTSTSRCNSILSAKKSGSKQAPRASGGFATVKTAGKKASSATSASDNDYKVFPRLEAAVQHSLVPAPRILAQESGVLTDEVYDRLEQIYGFPNFNYASPSASPLANLLSIPHDDDDDSASELAQSLQCLPAFDQFRILHMDPLVLVLDEFFTLDECDRYVHQSLQHQDGTVENRSPTVGKDAAAKAQRTSTTFYHYYRHVPELLAKATRLLGLDTLERWEEPQTVRYRRNEQFTWHLDALGPLEDKSELGGQRLATLLVYLTELSDMDGGATVFRDLYDADGQPLQVRPRKGTALLFFPSAGGIPHVPIDFRTLHCGQVVAADASQDKWISQLWLRQGVYRPTAPVGNVHADAIPAIREYCHAS